MRRRAARAVFAIALGAAGVGCNQIFGLDPADHTDAAIDATIDADLDSTVDASLGKWNTPVLLPSFATGNNEQDPFMTDDGLELYAGYEAVASPTLMDVVVSRRVATNQDWPPPIRVAEVSSPSNDATPRILDGGRVMYFATDRAGGAGGHDIWKSMRSSSISAWSLPARETASGVNSMANDRHLMPCLGVTRHVFASDRTGNQSDLFELRNGDAVPVPAASSQAIGEAAPFIAADCLTIYFSANLAGDYDLYVMTRLALDTDFSPPVRIDELSSAGVDDVDPWVSADGKQMLFASIRGGTFDIYEATR